MMNSVAATFQEHSWRAQTHLVSIMPRNLRDCEAAAATGSESLRTKLTTKGWLRHSSQDVLRNEQPAIIPSAVCMFFDFKKPPAALCSLFFFFF